jgi:hypothetical protein
VNVNVTERQRTTVVVLGDVVAAAAAVGYVLVRCGWGTYPSLQVLLDISAAYPTILEITPFGQYVHYSPAGPVLARLVSVDTPVAYQVLHVGVFVVSAAVLVGIVARRYGRQVTWMVVVAFITSQAVVVLSAWLGSYDVFTWVIGTAVVLIRSRIGAAIVGLLGAFAAFEQTVISVVLLAAVTGMGRPASAIRYLAALAGLVVGRLWLALALSSNGAPHDRLDFLRRAGPSRFVDQFTEQIPLFALTAFGGAWITLICCLGSIPARERIRWIVALVVAVIPCALGEDQTRVYALVTWPLLLAIVLRAGPLLSGAQRRRANGLSLVAGLIIPPIYIWAGTAYLSNHHVWHVLA